MRRLAATGALIVLSLATPTAFAEELRPDHPIIGTWKITLPDNSCHEIYRVRANGTSVVTSADEVAESTFDISDQPSPKGFYKWVDKITKDNGQKDCSGEVMEIGHEATNFITFHPSGNMFLMCEKEDLNTCIGPFVRQKWTDT